MWELEVSLLTARDASGAIEFADTFPDIEVVGVDLSPIQPTMTPPNLKFMVDDIEQPWAYPRPFDFIFSRQLLMSLGDWPGLMRQAYANLVPGGWVEFQDYTILPESDDDSVTENDVVIKWERLLIDAAYKIGREPCPGPKLEQWVRDAGFVNITHRRFKIPGNTWPKDPAMKKLGAWLLAVNLQGVEGYSLRLLCDVLGWTEAQVHVLLAGVRTQLKDRNWHGYWAYDVVYAQRPGGDAPSATPVNP